MANELKEIDIDLINEMRSRGLWGEAQALIEAFRNDLKKNMEQGRLEIRRIESRTYQLKKRKINKGKELCSCGKKSREGYKSCDSCLLRTKRYGEKCRKKS